MLYVSRLIGYDKYGVYDTDDGIENVACRDDIWEAHQLGVVIHGVTSMKKVSSGAPGRSTIDIVPYQPVETMSVAQIKLQTLRHVKICTFNGCITSIVWDSSKIKEPVRIKLSDFGRKLGYQCVSNNDHCPRHVVTLVFDNNISVAYEALYTVRLRSNAGAVYDVSAVTNKRIISEVYRQVCSIFSWDRIPGYIIDNPERRKRMMKKYGDQVVC